MLSFHSLVISPRQKTVSFNCPSKYILSSPAALNIFNMTPAAFHRYSTESLTFQEMEDPPLCKDLGVDHFRFEFNVQQTNVELNSSICLKHIVER